MAIQKILCCCGSGLGSSLMVEMNVQDVLKDLGVDGVEVEHSTVSDVMPGAADLLSLAAILAILLQAFLITKRLFSTTFSIKKS